MMNSWSSYGEPTRSHITSEGKGTAMVGDEIRRLRLRHQFIDQAVGDGGHLRAQRHHPLGAELLREHSPVVIVARIVHADERALLLVDDDARFGHGREVGVRELAAEARIRHHAAHIVVAREQPRAPPVPQTHGDDRLRRSRLRVLRRRLQRIDAAEGKAGWRCAVIQAHPYMIMVPKEHIPQPPNQGLAAMQALYFLSRCRQPRGDGAIARSGSRPHRAHVGI